MACNGLCGFFLGSLSLFHIGRQLTLPRVQRVQPALPAGRESGPVAQLHDLGLGELAVQVGPECIVCQVRVPEHGIGVTQSDFLAFSESAGLRVVLQFV